MKNGFKLSSFASAVLHVLLLLLPISAFSRDVEKPDIRVPYVADGWPNVVNCFGIALSPNGDGFYSVYGDLLTHYQINPFTKVDSVAIDHEPLKDIRHKGRCRVLVTEESSKLILVFPYWIVSVDRGTGKVTKMFERRGLLGNDGTDSSVLNGNDLVILGQYKDEDKGWGYLFRMAVLDINTFHLKKHILNVGQEFKYFYTSQHSPEITKIRDRLYLSSGDSLLVLNSKTYEPELTLSNRGIIRISTSHPSQLFTTISKDGQKLHVENATFVNDYLTNIQKDFGNPKDNAVLFFDQATRQFSRGPTHRKKETRQLWLDLYDRWLFSREQSRNMDYVSGMVFKSHALIRDRNSAISYRFFPYESGEAVLIQEQYLENEKKTSIQHTQNGKQYLKNHQKE